jgi:hypothetical protein
LDKLFFKGYSLDMKSWKILILLVFSFVAIAVATVFFLPSKKIRIESQNNEVSEEIKTAEITNVAQDSKNQLSEQNIVSENNEQQKADLPKVEKSFEKSSVEKKVNENTPEEKIIEEKSTAKSNLVSWGFQKASGRTIDTIVIHTTYNALGGDPYDFTKVLAEWKDYGVAPHYAIDRGGKTYQLVSDQNIAYHAGSSKMPDGRSNVNNFSIGIEVVNTQDGKFADAQYAALNNLIASLKSKYKIKYVLGHSEIASGRKTDPWGIDWKRVDK